MTAVLWAAQQPLDFEALVPPQTSLKRIKPIPGEKTQIAEYLSRKDQNSLEQYYRSFLEDKGFRYRGDRDVRSKASRSLRFDRQDQIIEVNFTSQGRHGTAVTIKKYAPVQEMPDMKDLVSFDGPMVKLPKEAGPIYRTTDGPVDIQKVKDFAVPPPPKSKLAEEKPSEAIFGKDTQAVFYLSELSPKAVELFYESFFKRQGFEHLKAEDAKVLGFKRLRHQRKDLVVDVFIFGIETGAQVGIAKYPASDVGLEVEKNPFSFGVQPKRDVLGWDFTFIPRPPESIRWMNSRFVNKSSVTYLTELSLAEVRKFYLAKMPPEGWKLAQERNTQEAMSSIKKATGKEEIPGSNQLPLGNNAHLEQVIENSHVLNFLGNQGEVRVIIYPNFMKGGSRTVVDIMYRKFRAE